MELAAGGESRNSLPTFWPFISACGSVDVARLTPLAEYFSALGTAAEPGAP
ncbi:hypothetical protein [Sorangium sp. So ce1389]|uniref:hypothetical protein n=1 Tax=Sorangium sp. So ce1389 TaxID=3133336 RepID=UPI003F6209FE